MFCAMSQNALPNAKPSTAVPREANQPGDVQPGLKVQREPHEGRELDSSPHRHRTRVSDQVARLLN